MSAEAITDAAVRHFIEHVDGIRGGYASGAGGQGESVRTMPTDIYATPVAILEMSSVRWQLSAGSFETVTWYFDVNVWVEASDPGASTLAVVPFMSRVIASLRTNATLYGTCQWALATSGGPITAETVNGKPYLALPIHITAVEATATTYSHQP